MRTTVDLPDATFRQLKSLAAQRGMTLKELLRVAVENEMQRMKPLGEQRAKLPILDSKQPGALRLTNAQIEEILT